MTDLAPKYWFPAKRYGWGWGLPSTWQGWVVLLSWLAIVLGASPLLLPQHRPFYVVFVVGMVALLTGICYAKGEPPRWRWGRDDRRG